MVEYEVSNSCAAQGPLTDYQGGLKMNYNQNHKISQITSSTLIIGVDIAKHKHVARAQDFRGIEFGKAITFENKKHGFESLEQWIQHLLNKHGMSDVIIGMEPTGHYWLNLAHYLKGKEIKFVIVNPMHVKKSKELDDNSPTKNDVKDAKVIAQLVKDGRYAEPNLPDGIYADLREGMKLYDLLSSDLQSAQGQVHNWIDRYFPEFLTVFKDWEGKAALQVLKLCLLPHELLTMDDYALLAQIKKEAKRGVGLARVRSLKDAARRSIGIKEGSKLAKLELETLLEKYCLIQKKLEELELQLDELLKEISGVTELLQIKGIGKLTVAGFFAEVGDLSKYKHPKQIQKLAGLNLRLNTSGKHKGQTKITKRGRPGLRALLFRVIMPLVAQNPAFKALHQYYTTRPVNPLKKKQSLIALCCKLIRILFTVATKQCQFSYEKMLNDIPHMNTLQEAA